MAGARNRPRQSSPLNLPSAFDLFKPSKEIVLKNIWIFGPLYAVPVILWVHNWIWTPAASGGSWWEKSTGVSGNWGFSPIASWGYATVGFSIIWFLLAAVGGTIAQFMITVAALQASEDKALDFRELWQVVKKIGWRLLGLYLLIALYVIVGFILLIIPGIIMIRRYFLAPYVMIDKNCGVTEAMELSAAMSKPYSGSIYGIIGVTILIGLIGIVPFIGSLASLIVGMLYVLAPALRYQQLKKLT
ncbi:MAG TPA: hypothetical protein VEH48_01800 [Candidatus Nitrosopolaris sp.]|nr:hypothetical protein [Candidatus Nitrosopolaris sp.]